MMRSNKILSFVKILLLLILFIFSLVLLGNSLFQQTSVQRFLIKSLSDVSGWDIQIDSMELNFWHGLGIYIKDLSARSPGDKHTIHSSGARIILNAKGLFKGRIIPTDIYLLQPDITLSIEEISDSTGYKGQEPLGEIRNGWIPNIKSISIENGNLAINAKPYKFENIQLEVSQKTHSPLTLLINSRGNIFIGDRIIPYKALGTLFGMEQALPSFNISLETNAVPLDFFNINDSIGIDKSIAKSRLAIKGSIYGETSVNGSLFLNPLFITLNHREHKKDIILEKVSIDFNTTIHKKSLDISSLNLNSGDLSLDVSMKLKGANETSPYIDLSVKSTPMAIETFKTAFPSPLVPWIEEELFPIFEDGKVQLQSFNIKGNLEQLRDLNKQENQSVMNMIFDCRHFQITGSGIRIPFKDMSAHVAIAQGDLKIAHLNTVFGTSILEDCILEIKNIYGGSSYLETTINGIFDLQELMSQRNMGFLPKDILPPLDYLKSLSGKMKCHTVIGYKNEWDFPCIISGDFEFMSCLLQQESIQFPLSIDKAEFHIDEDNLNYFKGVGSWGGSSIDTSGSFGINGKEFRIYRADIESTVDMNHILAFLKAPADLPIKFKDRLPSRISFVQRKDKSSFFGEVKLEGIILENDEFSVDPPGEDNNIIFELDYSHNKNVELKDTMIRFGDSHMQIAGLWNLQGPYKSRLDLKDMMLDLDSLGILYKRTGTYVSGTLNGDLAMILSRNDPQGLSISGEMNGAKLCLNSGIIRYPIKDLDFSVGFMDKHVRILSCNMNIGRSNISLTGELEGWDGFKGDLRITSSFIDSSDILPRQISLKSLEEPEENSFLTNIHINGELDIGKGLWRNLKWNSFKAGILIRGKDLFIRNSDIKLEHGDMDIIGHIKRGENANIFLNSKIRLIQQPVDELLSDIRSPFKEMKGNLDLIADLSVNGKEQKDIVSSLSGTVNVWIENGLINKSTLGSRILDSLSLQNIYKKRPAEMRQKGFYFENMSADAEIRGGELKSDNFIMKSPAFNSVANGKVNLNNKTVDFIMGVQPHGTIDSIVSRIPILGYIITGENRSIITYPFKVTGLISNPQVDFIPTENLGKSVRGILERLFLTPKRLWDELQDSNTPDGKKAQSVHDNKS